MLSCSSYETTVKRSSQSITVQVTNAHLPPLFTTNDTCTPSHTRTQTYLLGVSALDITQLEAGEEVGVLEVEVAQVPEVVEDLEHLGPHALPALQGTVAGCTNNTCTHHLLSWG